MPNAGEPLTPILYSKPGCVQCISTKRALDKHGVEVRVIDVTESEQGEARVRELGYQQLPVMEIPFDQEVFHEGDRVQHWYGFRPDLVAQLAVKQVTEDMETVVA